jgi:hypothetical protein
MVIYYDLATFLLGDGGDMYAQEPGYTDLDKEFLQEMEVKVLEVADGGLGGVLREGTLVFEPFMDMSEAILRDLVRAEVGLYVGSSIKGIAGRVQGRDGVLGKLAREFCERREVLGFPRFEVEPNVMEGMGIYWKEEKDEE